MTKITHGLGLPRYAIGVVFRDGNNEPLKGGVFSIEDDNTIELDDEWLASNPQIDRVEIFGVGDNYEGKRYGWVRDEEPQTSVSALDTNLANLIELLKVGADAKMYGIGAMRWSNGIFERVDPATIRLSIAQEASPVGESWFGTLKAKAESGINPERVSNYVLEAAVREIERLRNRIDGAIERLVVDRSDA